MQLILEKRLPQSLPYFALTGAGRLPSVEADEAHDFVDVFDQHEGEAIDEEHQGGDVMPARAFGIAPEGDIRRGGFADSGFGIRLRAARRIPDEVFDGVLFIDIGLPKSSCQMHLTATCNFCIMKLPADKIRLQAV